jgi:hypothetical protein
LLYPVYPLPSETLDLGPCPTMGFELRVPRNDLPRGSRWSYRDPDAGVVVTASD